MTEAAASKPSGGRAAGGFRLRGPARLLSDDRLAQRAAAGDRVAFEEIFRRYHQDLYRFCLATAANAQDAQDALQNTMVKVMRALPGEERQIKLKPWLYRIARNESVETVRRRRDSAELDAERTAAPWEIAETAAARDRLRGLLSDLEELPERQRSALVMRELGGLSFEEIGETFDTTPAVARQTLYEARQSLRQMDAGREMSCESVTRALSDADGRVTRRRDVRAHLRSCAGCRAFRDGIAERRGEFAAIAPLPLAVSVGLLHGLLGGQAGAAVGVGAGSASIAASAGTGAGGAGGLAGTVGAGAGKAIATSAIVKSAATVAVAAAVGVGAAERGGVIDLPPGGGGGRAPNGISEPARPSFPAAPSAAAERGGAGEPGAEARRGPGPSAGSKGAVDSPRLGAGKGKGRPAHAGRSKRARPAHSKSRGHSGRDRPQAARGRPAPAMPPTTGRGPATAGERNSRQANPSPGPGGSAKSTPAPQPAPPAKAESEPALPSARAPAPVESPAAANSGRAPTKGAGTLEAPRP